MTFSNRVLRRIALLTVCGVLAAGPVVAQDEEEDTTKTKQAQAVSKEVYDRIQKAQELIDADEPQEALQLLNSLKTRKGITEYELQNVLNYIGFVHYNMDNIDQATATYEKMLRSPSLEPQLVTTLIGSNDVIWRRNVSAIVDDARRLVSELPEGTILSRLVAPLPAPAAAGGPGAAPAEPGDVELARRGVHRAVQRRRAARRGNGAVLQVPCRPALG